MHTKKTNILSTFTNTFSKIGWQLNLLLLFICSYTFATNTQNTTEPSINEQILVHYNTQTLLSGETLLFKVYCINNNTKQLSSLSKIAYIELINENKEIVHKQKILLKKGTGYGDLFIKPELNTGVYKIIAYTKSMLNSKKVSSSNLIILNPFRQLPNNNQLLTIDTTEVTKNKTNRVDSYHHKDDLLTLNKSVYGFRDKVTASLNKELLNNNFKHGNYSVSVRKIDELSRLLDGSSENKTTPIHTLNEDYIIPEIRGEVIKGHILNLPKENTDITMALSVPGEVFDFKLASTNQNNFFFILDNPNRKKDIIIQPLDNSKVKFKIDTTFIDYNKIEFENSFSISPSLEENIKKRYLANQIENAYYHLHKDTIQTFVTNPNNLFYHPLEKSYVLDDYKRFPTLKETIIEIIPEMYFKNEENNTYSLHLRDYYNKEYHSLYGKTLVFLDGVYTKDVTSLFEMNMNTVEKIDIVNKGYLYSSKLYNGIINIITKNKEIGNLTSEAKNIIHTQLLRTEKQKNYFIQEYENSKKERTPDYRYQLYWNPELNVTESNQIEYYTSDVSGTYEIIIQGYKEDGSLIKISTKFKVANTTK